MTRRTLIAVAAFGSMALLAGAFLFQFAGFAPCQLCLWQRWPHAAAGVIGVAALISAQRPAALWCGLGALAALTTGAIAVFHSGVERKWWAGLESCSSGGALTGDLLDTSGPALVLCDEIPWQMFGLSMANYNVLASLALAAIWLLAARR